MKTNSADENDYVEFATAVSGRLLNTAMLLTTDRHLAEDLVQETLGKLYASWRRVAKADNPAAYARATLVHTYISHRRWRGSSEYATEFVPERGAAGPDIPLRLTLLESLARLEPKERAVLVLRYWDDLTVEQVARELGISAGAVRNRAMRALQRLRALLGDELHALIG
ncbi:SigE family RNA polymerase sigma factor [Actinospica robiniae]|uniref:SigE family RNA polymerase sigma factor n=1 Tax=Actinospica robiniae TaxID=304901 RepID=UPI00041A9EA5|nr:SigE family RNA polymerase sigma factor [Actinospica robiniae]